jgi:hypothetical protein
MIWSDKLPPLDIQELVKALGPPKRGSSVTYEREVGEVIWHDPARGLMLYFPKAKKRGRPKSSPERDRQIAAAFYGAKVRGSKSAEALLAAREVPGAAVLTDARLLRIAQQNRPSFTKVASKILK